MAISETGAARPIGTGGDVLGRWFAEYSPTLLLGLFLVLRAFRPDRPPKPLPLRIDWTTVTLFAAWLTSAAAEPHEKAMRSDDSCLDLFGRPSLPQEDRP